MIQIVETAVFTRLVNELMDDDSYRMLQLELIASPGQGKIIPRSGGLRKIRWRPEGRGKRGGTRIIYYWAVSRDIIVMLYAFSKNVQDDLSERQLRVLRQIVESEFK